MLSLPVKIIERIALTDVGIFHDLLQVDRRFAERIRQPNMRNMYSDHFTVIDKFGYKRVCGRPHCFTGPTKVYGCGTVRWYINGEPDREDGPDGSLPAHTLSDGTKHWFKKGLHHREDGPAVEYMDGRLNRFCLHGRFMEQKRYRKIMTRAKSQLCPTLYVR